MRAPGSDETNMCTIRDAELETTQPNHLHIASLLINLNWVYFLSCRLIVAYLCALIASCDYNVLPVCTVNQSRSSHAQDEKIFSTIWGNTFFFLFSFNWFCSRIGVWLKWYSESSVDSQVVSQRLLWGTKFKLWGRWVLFLFPCVRPVIFSMSILLRWEGEN